MATKNYEEKVKLNKLPMIFIIAVILIIAGVLVFTNLPKGDSAAIAKDYTGLSSDNCFKKISYSKMIKKIEDGEMFYVFLGHKTCDACQERIVFVDEIVTVGTVYYLNSDTLDEDDLAYIKATYGIRELYPQFIAFNYTEAGSVASTYAYVKAEDTPEAFQMGVRQIYNDTRA